LVFIETNGPYGLFSWNFPPLLLQANILKIQSQIARLNAIIGLFFAIIQAAG